MSQMQWRADAAIRLTFVEYSQMSDEQREDYAQSWLFIHGKAKA